MAPRSASSAHPPVSGSYEIEGITYTVHPVAALFPCLPEDSPQFTEMVEDIRERGLLEPIHVQGRVFVDGRNRFAAARAAGCPIRVNELAPDVDVSSFVMSKNFVRRHLTEDQRAGISAAAVQLRDLERQDAWRMNRHLRRGRAAAKAAREAASSPSAEEPSDTGALSEVSVHPAESPDPPSGDSAPPLVPPKVTLADAAKTMNVSPVLVARANAVTKKAPDLASAINADILKVVDAERLARHAPSVRQKTVALLQESGSDLSFADALHQAGGPPPTRDRRRPRARSGRGDIPQPAADAQDSALPPPPGEPGSQDSGSASGDSPASPVSPASSAPASSSVAAPAPAASPGAPPAAPLPARHFGPVHDAPSPHVQSPDAVLDSVRVVLGRIDLDPCSSEEAQQRVGALRWFTSEDDAFSEPWKGSVYAFPPLDALDRFASHLAAELDSRRVGAAAFYAPCDFRDRWAVDLLNHRAFAALVVGRESEEFLLPGAAPWRPGYPFALYFFGKVSPDRVLYAFAPWGTVLSVRRESA